MSGEQPRSGRTEDSASEVADGQLVIDFAAKRLCHLFPSLPKQPGFHKRRARLSDTIEALIAEFARMSPGFYDDVLLVDSTPA